MVTVHEFLVAWVKEHYGSDNVDCFDLELLADDIVTNFAVYPLHE